MPLTSFKPEEITFIVPEFMTGIGGIEMLVVNLSRAIAESQQDAVNCRVICPRGSFVHKELSIMPTERVSIIHWGEAPATGGSNSLLVCWGGLGSLVKLRAENPRILVWTVMPGQMFVHLNRAEKSIPLLGRYFRQLRKRIGHYLATTSGVVHMDRPNKFAFEQTTGIQTDDNYLPIPVQVRSNQFLENLRIEDSPKTLRVSWVGRSGTPWKVIPLIRFFEDAILPCDGRIHLTVFTDDAEPYRSLFETRGISNSIHIIYEIGVMGDVLRDRLGREFHLHLAMGTGALEGAAVGAPSVCINPQSVVTQRASWQWLHEKQGHDLGDFNPHESTRTPFDLNAYMMDRTAIETHSTLCHKHVILNHDIKVILSRLIANRSSANLHGYLRAHGILGKVVGLCNPTY